MKKTVLILLSGLFLMAFASCGGKSSKEYKEAKAFFDKMEKSVKQAKDCDELQKAALGIFDNALEEKEFAEGDRMTEEENKLIQKQFEQINEKVKEKMDEFGCEPIKLF